MAIWVWIGAGVVAAIAARFLFGRTARSAIAGEITAGGKRVVRIRGKWLRSPFAAGLTPLALVYRVTTQSDDDSGRVTVKLYAYDAGQWFSRHEHEVRQFSGGVWRRAL